MAPLLSSKLFPRANRSPKLKPGPTVSSHLFDATFETLALGSPLVLSEQRIEASTSSSVIRREAAGSAF
jgi:hypothetical protein